MVNSLKNHNETRQKKIEWEKNEFLVNENYARHGKMESFKKKMCYLFVVQHSFLFHSACDIKLKLKITPFIELVITIPTVKKITKDIVSDKEIISSFLWKFNLIDDKYCDTPAAAEAVIVPVTMKIKQINAWKWVVKSYKYLSMDK